VVLVALRFYAADMPITFGEMRANVVHIDDHAEAIAAKTEAGSDLNELAHAIHNLCTVLREIVGDLESHH
jgi:hypothetical protein